jgi:hypothetical protein
MPRSLIASQLEALEDPAADELDITITVPAAVGSAEAMVAHIYQRMGSILRSVDAIVPAAAAADTSARGLFDRCGSAAETGNGAVAAGTGPLVREIAVNSSLTVTAKVQGTSFSCVGLEVAVLPVSIFDFLPSMASLTHIDVSFGSLSECSALSETPLLETFIADQNLICTVTAVPKLRKLMTLSLNKNRIADTQVLVAELQHRFPKLTFLSLLGNGCCPSELHKAGAGGDSAEGESSAGIAYRRYRQVVFDAAPTLNFLDANPISKIDEGDKEVDDFVVVEAKTPAADPDEADGAPTPPFEGTTWPDQPPPPEVFVGTTVETGGRPTSADKLGGGGGEADGQGV